MRSFRSSFVPTALSLLVFIGMGHATVAEGANGPAIGNPHFAGEGCSEDTVTTIFSPDRSVLSILFDDYVASAGAEDRKWASNSCDFDMVLEVPPGYRLSALDIDFRGYAYVPPGGEARLASRYVVDGKKGPVRHDKMRGPSDSEFSITHGLHAPNPQQRFDCGADVHLDAQTWLQVRKAQPHQDDEVYMALDSADVEPAIQVSLQWEPC